MVKLVKCILVGFLLRYLFNLVHYLELASDLMKVRVVMGFVALNENGIEG